MTKLETTRAAAAPEPVDQSPIGGSVASAIASRREESEAYVKEADRLAAYEAVARVAVLRRGELGLTQAEVARRMKTTGSVVSRIESGRHPTTARTLKRLFEALEGRLVIGAEFTTPDAGTRQDLVVLDQPPFSD